MCIRDRYVPLVVHPQLLWYLHQSYLAWIKPLEFEIVHEYSLLYWSLFPEREHDYGELALDIPQRLLPLHKHLLLAHHNRNHQIHPQVDSIVIHSAAIVSGNCSKSSAHQKRNTYRNQAHNQRNSGTIWSFWIFVCSSSFPFGKKYSYIHLFLVLLLWWWLHLVSVI